MLRRVFFHPSPSRGVSFSPVLLEWRRPGGDGDNRKRSHQSQRRCRGSLRDEDGSRVQDDNKDLQYYGFNNFQRLLQIQGMRQRQNDNAKPKPKKSSAPRRSAGPGVGVTPPEPTPNYDIFKRMFAGDDQPRPKEEVYISDVNQTGYNNFQRDGAKPKPKKSSKPRSRNAGPGATPGPNVAKSSWILVENTPNSANVSDLYQSLNEILEFEVGKGIIDLDGIANNEKALAALEKIGASESLYTTQAIEDEDIPLWTPGGDPAVGGGARCPLLEEARPYLSYWARPTGFFLRLPNRSVAHALLKHLEKAGALLAEEKKLQTAENWRLGKEREEWVTGLWKKVQADYAQENAHKRIQGSSQGEEEMTTQDPPDEDTSKSLDLSEGECDDSRVSEGSDSDEVFDFLQEYSESNPYPLRSATLNPEPSDFGVLRCGSMRVSVKPFVPFQDPNPETRQREGEKLRTVPSWEQHAFEISGNLRLCDSIVRVVTSSRIRTNELQHFFRHCDLEATWPTEEEGVGDCFRDMPSSIGWNLNGTGRRSNVDLLLSPSVASRSEWLASKRAGRPKAKKHTYLVRFSSPSAARMAVRNYQGAELRSRRRSSHGETYSEMRHELKLAQYPGV